MKKLITAIVVIAILAAAAVAVYSYRKKGPEVQVTTAPVSQGDIVQVVGATGTIEAVQTVQVGTQVSGIVQELRADFNSIVKKGQLIAKLDPSSIQTQIEQARANLIRAQADLERQKVALEDAKTKAKRTEELAAKKLVAQSELDTVIVNVKSAEAQLRSQLASITQAEASLNQNQVNLQHTEIYSPIDGIVISRNVDVGQTVAASMQAPTLFILAADLTKMQVRASVDESDVGLIRPGQQVRFRVDAYPAQDFIGTVAQVRLQPVVSQNVVTYVTVIDVPNPDLKLKPGMTANVTIEIAQRTNALRVQNTTLRFRPTNEMFAALNQAVPPELSQRGGRGAAGRGADGGARAAGPSTQGTGAATSTPTAAASAPPPAAPRSGTAPTASQAQGGQRQAAGQGDATDEERRQRFQQRLASMSPEERAQFEARMRERGIDPSNPGAGRSGGQRSFGPQNPARATAPGQAQGAQTIDQLFGPLQMTITPGRVWVYANKQIKQVRLRLGISDGTYTEVVGGDGVQPGAELVTNIDTGTGSTTRTTNPFMPGGRPGAGPSGMPGGFGGGQRR